MALTAALLAGCGDRATDVGEAAKDAGIVVAAQTQELVPVIPDSVLALYGGSLAARDTVTATLMANGNTHGVDLVLWEAAAGDLFWEESTLRGRWMELTDANRGNPISGVICALSDTAAATRDTVLALAQTNGHTVAGTGTVITIEFIPYATQEQVLQIPHWVSIYGQRSDVFTDVGLCLPPTQTRNF